MRRRSKAFLRPLTIGIFTAAIVGACSLWLLTAVSTSTRGVHILGVALPTGTVDAKGHFEPMMSVTVGSSISGVIEQVSCDESVRVKKGQICARIDARPYQAEVDQDRASLATAMAQLEKDQASFTYESGLARRYKQLLAQHAVSDDQFDNVDSLAAQAKAQVDYDKATAAQRKATLDAARVGLEYTNIVSPIDGVVVSRNATVGETVTAQFQSPTLFVIASDLSKMQLNANIGQKYIDLIRIGDHVTYSVEALPDRQFQGTVGQIRLAPKREGNEITYEVSISADNREGLFRPGMLAQASIHIGDPENALNASR